MHSINWAGNICKLVNESGEEINIGHQFEDERENRLLLLEGGRAPHKPSSSGKVYVSGGEYFPHVFGFKWVDTGAKAPVVKVEAGYNRAIKLRGFK